jgi:hypothetical protein
LREFSLRRLVRTVSAKHSQHNLTNGNENLYGPSSQPTSKSAGLFSGNRKLLLSKDLPVDKGFATIAHQSERPFAELLPKPSGQAGGRAEINGCSSS